MGNNFIKENTAKTIQTTKRIIIGIIKSGLLSFALYLSSYYFINIVIYKEDYVSERNFTPVYILMNILYIISNYIMYIRKQSDNQKIEAKPDKFNLKEVLVEYLNEEGKLLLIIYAVLAIINDIAKMITCPNFISITVGFLFPMCEVFYGYPILRMVLGYFITIIPILIITVLEKYRHYKRWNKNH